jgi:hypothetical protein
MDIYLQRDYLKNLINKIQYKNVLNAVIAISSNKTTSTKGIENISNAFNQLSSEEKELFSKEFDENEYILDIYNTIYSNKTFIYLKEYLDVLNYETVAVGHNTSRQNVFNIINNKFSSLQKDLDSKNIQIDIKDLLINNAKLINEDKKISNNQLVKELIQVHEIISFDNILLKLERLSTSVPSPKVLHTIISKLKKDNEVYSYDNKVYCNKEIFAKIIDKIDYKKISQVLKDDMKKNGMDFITSKSAYERILQLGFDEVSDNEISIHLLSELLIKSGEFKNFKRGLSI